MYTDPVPNIAEHQEQTEITKTAPDLAIMQEKETKEKKPSTK